MFFWENGMIYADNVYLCPHKMTNTGMKEYFSRLAGIVMAIVALTGFWACGEDFDPDSGKVYYEPEEEPFTLLIGEWKAVYNRSTEMRPDSVGEWKVVWQGDKGGDVIDGAGRMGVVFRRDSTMNFLSFTGSGERHVKDEGMVIWYRVLGNQIYICKDAEKKSFDLYAEFSLLNGILTFQKDDEVEDENGRKRVISTIRLIRNE
jgi:hypothetical protein